MRRLVPLLAALFFFVGCESPVPEGPIRLRVLTYNIHHGEGRDGEFDYARLARVISDINPDVVALQEVDRKTRRASGIDQAKLLGKLTGMHSTYGRAMYYSGGEYGEAILSRFPIVQSRAHPLPFTTGREPRAALEARIRPSNGLPEFILVGTHLCHQRGETRADQTRQINRLLAADDGPPIILAGDLNARKGSEAMNNLLDERWIDATAPVSRIDYILLRPGDPWRVVEVQAIEERVASDHLPILAVLEWTPPSAGSEPNQ